MVRDNAVVHELHAFANRVLLEIESKCREFSLSSPLLYF